MKRRRSGLLVPNVLALVAVLWLSPPLEAADSLTAKDQKDLTEAVRLLDRGDHAAAHKGFVLLVNRLSDEQLADVDKQLAKQDLPNLGKLLAGSRLIVVTQGLEKSLPVPSAREAILILPEFQTEISAVFDKLIDEPLLADPLRVPATIEDFEASLWQAHVLENKLANTEKFARHMAVLAKSVPRSQVAKLTEEQRKLLEANHVELQEQVKQYAQAVEEREIELRLQRLELAREVLAKPELTRERWFAAGAWNVDEHLIQEFLKNRKGEKPLRAALQASGLSQRVQKLATDANKLAGDLTAKVNLFGVAMHWWMRGRYGMGPEFYGLAKSEYSLRTPAGEFALRMPSEPPQPTDPTQPVSKYYVPQYDRRHHYWWAWEHRRVLRQGERTSGPATTTEKIEGNDPRAKTVWLAGTSFT